MRVLVLALLAASAADGAYVGVAKDFVADFEASMVVNSTHASASSEEPSGGVGKPGIFLHPLNAEDSAVVYRGVAVPAAPEEGGVFLVFSIGIRDSVPWDDAERLPNGVRFSVWVGGREVFGEARRGDGWAMRAVDLGEWSGAPTDIEFHTNAIDGHTNFDWAVFGEPLLVTMPGGADVGAGLSGLALVESADGRWDAVEFEDFGSVNAARGRVLAAAFAAELTAPELGLSSPLVVAGEPFGVLYRVENRGRGAFGGGKTATLQTGYGSEVSQAIPRIEAGGDVTLQWDGLSIPAAGDYVYEADGATLSFHVFPSNAEVAATVGNEQCRLSVVVDAAGHAYGVGEVWDGAGWQRACSVYPLAQVVLAEGALDLRVTGVESGLDGMQVRMSARHGGADWPVVVWFKRAGGTPAPQFAQRAGGTPAPQFAQRAGGTPAPQFAQRAGGTPAPQFAQRAGGTPAPQPAQQQQIIVESVLVPPVDSGLAAFYGPVVLAGDRAYGAEKDFAIFPGLEYLEGAEGSSSTRDLAKPLNDRRVPAPHKVAAPVMAVQGRDTLVALLWDMRAEWAAGRAQTAARFDAPAPGAGADCIHMSLFAPSVGEYVRENEYAAREPFPMKAGEPVRVRCRMVLDHANNYGPGSVVRGPHKGGLVLQAMRHWFDAYGVPSPSPQPRDWDAERALCRHACLHSVWSEEPAGWSHCVGWAPGLHVGLAVPLLIDLRAGVPDAERAEVTRRIDAVVGGSIARNGPGSLWSNAGCHIMLGELPFYRGHVGESMAALRDSAARALDGREDGRWVWRTSDAKLATLGEQGGHTLGQAALPSFKLLRAARLSGDADLAARALEAMRQMELYDVPRGAQMWECPMYQPDILAAAYAIRAYCEAYRLTGEPEYLEHARYWAWTGLPFLYLWEMDGYPTMKYNVISVIGSTFYTHSWIGLPVVWCGLVYAYALQDLAEFDDSLDWRTVAQGITNSAMWQQYADGPSQGAYPDSWNMIKNKPNPADINPENIYVNEFRLRGQSPEIRCARLERDGRRVMVNSAADIKRAEVLAGGSIELELVSAEAVYTLVAPVDEPRVVEGAGARVAGSAELEAAGSGWLYDAVVKGVVVKGKGGRIMMNDE